VGKSVIFNQLTGGKQIIGNWPGKTVEKAEGLIEQEGFKIRVIDLPGIYSLSTYSEEEVVSREFIASKHPDLVIDVIDACNLERNLFFLFQLIELEVPIVVCLNQYDILEAKGLEIDCEKLSKHLGVPVIKTVATKNKGLTELFRVMKEILLQEKKPLGRVRYGKEVEERIAKLKQEIEQRENSSYPPRFVAIKLLENDPLITSQVKSQELSSLAENLKRELEAIHGEQAETVIISERYSVASRIAELVTRKKGASRRDLTDKVDNLLLHRVAGYLILIALVLLIFFIVFKFGSFLSEEISALFNPLIQYLENLSLPGFLKGLLVHGLLEGVVAGLAIVLPYIAPFYFLLAILEDTGYLARIAFLTDFLMHKLGVHGKAFIPLIESLGCNVPAILGTRIMERKRDRFITSVLATLIPCSARSVIIFGLVAVFLGPFYALLIYLIDFLIIFLVGLLLNRYLKGLPSGLIMEMPRLQKPVLKIIFRQTWIRLRDFTNFALPIIVGANLVMEILILTNSVEPISRVFAPISWFLGLPAFATVALLFGFLRKELTLVMLATFYGTTNFGAILTGEQIFIFGLVTMIYIPCIATIAALKREFGAMKALLVTAGEIIGAIIIGGLLSLFMRAL